MKKACVIGSSGKLGSAITRNLRCNHQVIEHLGRNHSDLTKENNVIEFSNAVNDIDLLICAIGKKIEGSATGEFDDFNKIFNINFFSIFLCCKHISKKMKENSCILIIGSVDGCFGNKSAMYSTAKSALHMYSRCLSKELVDRKINVNCIALGTLYDYNIENCAKSILGLADCKHINGQVIRIDGGNHTFPC